MSLTPSSGSRGGPAVDPAMPYEDAQQELEAIIRRIESGEIGLEEQLAAYERGVALHRHCQSLLARFEQQFADLSAQLQAPASGGAAGGASGGASGVAGGGGQAKPADGADEGRG